MERPGEGTEAIQCIVNASSGREYGDEKALGRNCLM